MAPRTASTGMAIAIVSLLLRFMAEPLITRGHSISHPADALGYILRKEREECNDKSRSLRDDKQRDRQKQTQRQQQVLRLRRRMTTKRQSQKAKAKAKSKSKDKYRDPSIRSRMTTVFGGG